MKQKIKS